jgi:hypothetical protein
MTAYEAAIEAHNEALAIYNAALVAFRSGGSFEAFAAAQATKKIADAAYDAAFEIAANLPEVEDLGEEDTQVEMFEAAL